MHLTRSSTRLVAWINRRALIGDLRLVYAAQTEEAALAALAEFEKKWGDHYPMVAQSWRSNWERVRQFFAFGHEIRRIILHDERDRVTQLLGAEDHAVAR